MNLKEERWKEGMEGMRAGGEAGGHITVPNLQLRELEGPSQEQVVLSMETPRYSTARPFAWLVPPPFTHQHPPWRCIC